MDNINYRAKNWNRIIDAAERYEKKYPGITFVCMKKNVAWWLQNRMAERGIAIKVDYYRSENMIGAASDERIGVCVGAPVSPINTYDGVSGTYEESQKKRIGSNHAAFWQAISRFKSPSSSSDSQIFCIGITEKEIRNMIKWGTDRKLYLKTLSCDRVEVCKEFDSPIIISTQQEKVYDTIAEFGEATKSMVMRKTNLKSGDVMMHIESLVKQGSISAKTSDMKRKPIVYSANYDT